jgi:hypothetical protein
VAAGSPLWCGDCNKPCKDPCNAWISSEYLLWWLKDAPLPGGGFGTPGGAFEYGSASGIRIGAGMVSDDHSAGIEGSFFILERRAASFSAIAPAGGIVTPVSVIPAGDVASITEWNRFWGGDALISKAIFGADSKKSCYEVDCLWGFEYLNLGERLNALAVGPAGTADALAKFQTRNQFYGLELGARGEYRCGHFFANLTGKCGLGEVHQGLQLDATATAGGVTMAASTHAANDDFAVVPQVTFEAGFDLTRNIRLYAGYDFLYWNNVIRPGDQTFAATPGVSLQQSFFWAHGLNFGAAIRF